jgi:hypothetical protein
MSNCDHAGKSIEASELFRFEVVDDDVDAQTLKKAMMVEE